MGSGRGRADRIRVPRFEHEVVGLDVPVRDAPLVQESDRAYYLMAPGKAIGIGWVTVTAGREAIATQAARASRPCKPLAEPAGNHPHGKQRTGVEGEDAMPAVRAAPRRLH